MTKPAAKTATIPRRIYLRERAQGMKEQPDITPVHIPGNRTPPLTLRDEMRRYVREELSKQATTQEMGSFEEEDDFEEPDGELDLLSPYSVIELAHEPDTPADDLEGAPTPEDLAETPEKPPEDVSPSPAEPLVAETTENSAQ